MSNKSTHGDQQRAWYLGCTADQVADRAVLVGDRSRVLLAAELLEDAEILNEDRGLTTATGSWAGESITVSAFGMGAPIAAVVLHELASLGVHTMVRLGTALSLGETQLGDLVVADGAISGESTSGTYVPKGYPAAPDLSLAGDLLRTSVDTGRAVRTGLIASYDGFYSEMFPDGVKGGRNALDLSELEDLGVVGLDMESSVVLSVGRALGVRSGVVCLSSVDGHDHTKLTGDDRINAERDLLLAGLNGIV